MLVLVGEGEGEEGKERKWVVYVGRCKFQETRRRMIK